MESEGDVNATQQGVRRMDWSGERATLATSSHKYEAMQAVRLFYRRGGLGGLLGLLGPKVAGGCTPSYVAAPASCVDRHCA